MEGRISLWCLAHLSPPFAPTTQQHNTIHTSTTTNNNNHQCTQQTTHTQHSLEMEAAVRAAEALMLDRFLARLTPQAAAAVDPMVHIIKAESDLEDIGQSLVSRWGLKERGLKRGLGLRVGLRVAVCGGEAVMATTPFFALAHTTTATSTTTHHQQQHPVHQQTNAKTAPQGAAAQRHPRHVVAPQVSRRGAVKGERHPDGAAPPPRHPHARHLRARLI